MKKLNIIFFLLGSLFVCNAINAQQWTKSVNTFIYSGDGTTVCGNSGANPNSNATLNLTSPGYSTANISVSALGVGNFTYTVDCYQATGGWISLVGMRGNDKDFWAATTPAKFMMATVTIPAGSPSIKIDSCKILGYGSSFQWNTATIENGTLQLSIVDPANAITNFGSAINTKSTAKAAPASGYVMTAGNTYTIRFTMVQSDTHQAAPNALAIDNPTFSFVVENPTISGKVTLISPTGTDITSGTGSNLGGTYIAILDALGKVVDYSEVGSGGSYTAHAPLGGNYTAVITTTLPVVGNTATASVPTGYIFGGEGSTTLGDGNKNGSFSITNLSYTNATGTNAINFAATVVVKADANTGVINTAISGNLSTNDIVPTGVSYGTTAPTLVSGPSGGSFTTWNANGTYTFTATTPGTYVYNVTTTVNGVTTTTPLTITVGDPAGTGNGISTTPDFAVVNQPTTGTATVDIHILDNDKSLNNNTALGTPTISTNPAHGSVSIVNGVAKYTPEAGYTGTDVFKYQVCETSGSNCKIETVTVTVNAAGSAPSIVASDDLLLVTAGTTTTLKGNVATNDVSTGGTPVVTPRDVTTPAGHLVLNSDGSYDFTPDPAYTGGTATFPYTICNGTVCSSATLVIVTSGIVALPVTFNEIFASLRNGQLLINWSTLTEKNFDHFIVEVSKDGVNWKTLTTVKSQAVNGNSDHELKYSVTKSLNEMSTLFGVSFNPIALLLLALVTFSFAITLSRKFSTARPMMTILLAISLMGTIGSCKKNTDTPLDNDKTKIYVRVTTVDKDGKTNVSKVVTAVNE